MSDRIYEVIEEAKLTDVASIGAGGWDWAQMSVWYSEDERQFFWLSDSGCSCSYFGMGVTHLADLENGSKDDALRAAKRFAEGSGKHHGMFSDHYLRAVEAIKNVQVAA